VASPRRESRRVSGSERIGLYTLLRLERGGLDAGLPGQFFMLDVPGHIMPRPFSICLAEKSELAFLINPVGPATRVLCELKRGQKLGVFGPLGNGFRTDVKRPLLVGGGIGIAPFPYAAQVMGSPPAVLGFRTARQAEAAELVPRAEVCIEPQLVTELIPAVPMDVLACGPEPMLHAVHALVPDAQLAWEAPMACGFGACYGCVVELDGESRRLCVEGPVLNGRPPVLPLIDDEKEAVEA
jgi:dihydroorotate dehydrogenase electron transfer subunit